MSVSKQDPELRMHKEWLGLLQPVGLVVSPLALVRKQAVIDSDGAVRLQAQLRELVDHSDPSKPACLRDLPSLLETVLGWGPTEYSGGEPDCGREPLPEQLEVSLPELDELLRPTYALRDVPGTDGADTPPWLLLVQELAPRTPLDDSPKDTGRGWHAPPQAKFERMLRELEVPIGLLSNGETLRLVYAPRGETSGHLSFPIAAMCEVANRPMLGALHMLLSADRLLGEADKRRLPALLEESRKYQNEVSTQLAEQVLGALLELLRGFQAADEATPHGELLRDYTGSDPKHVYGGLLTVLLRLVFLLYAEDRGLLPDDPTWAGNYSVVGLFERLREDAGRYPDTMDQRYGAWAWLLTLFRLVFFGGGHGESIHLPARKGQLFDPNEYAFLEGRPLGEGCDPGERLEPPRVSDGTIARVLRGLLILDGERLSYRSLDVEQIGSVYESMMGYEVERATGPSIGLGSKHVVVNLAELLGHKPGARSKWLKEQADVAVSGGALAALKQASTPEDAVAALQRRVSKRTPTILPLGSLYLQPGEERRRTGSHYTPRTLTEPIVRTTLRPVLEDLVTQAGGTPTEAQILGLKVCDPAMGSGAFLVEACRQLSEELVKAWDVHGSARVIPVDEEPLLHARRLVAEHCLYGVDKNPFAVNLAKLSLWLATLAKTHPFTFLDHALKCGDSLVGLTRKQIAEFRWDQEVADDGPLFARVREQVVAAVAARLKIHEAAEDADAEKRMWNEEAERALDDARLQGDAVIAAFFGAEKDKGREKLRVQLWDRVQRWHGGDASAKAELVEVVREMREERGVVPFHWEIEFPEVFGEGFDSTVGNPPFLGGKRISTVLGDKYRDWFSNTPGVTGNADLLALFIRGAYNRTSIKNAGTLGVVATNSVAQGDTRSSGLARICQAGGVIYCAERRKAWPGNAAVVVSIIHIRRGPCIHDPTLDGKRTSRITAFLLTSGGDQTPSSLLANAGVCFIGTYVLGMGFTFDDTSPEANPISKMHDIIKLTPENAEKIFPYIGGHEIASHPQHLHHRYVIDFGEASEAEARQWPELMAIIENKVKPERTKKKGSYARDWWLFGRRNQAGRKRLSKLDRALTTARVSNSFGFVFLNPNIVINEKAVIFAFNDFGSFAILQSRTHETWARVFSSSLKDDLNYTPTDCFATYAMPVNWRANQALESAGQTYYDYRAALMIRNDEGLTKTYNRFHDPDEDNPEIVKLRDLHAIMDHAVLEAYGWHELAARATCEFQLDYEEPDDDDDDSGRKRKKKKPWRYKWPQDFHDEVLAALLELNQTYAEQERIAGEAAANKKPKPKKKRAKKKAAKKKSDNPKQVSLLGDE